MPVIQSAICIGGDQHILGLGTGSAGAKANASGGKMIGVHRRKEKVGELARHGVKHADTAITTTAGDKSVIRTVGVTKDLRCWLSTLRKVKVLPT